VIEGSTRIKQHATFLPQPHQNPGDLDDPLIHAIAKSRREILLGHESEQEIRIR
jgi:hypothetical protein